MPNPPELRALAASANEEGFERDWIADAEANEITSFVADSSFLYYAHDVLGGGEVGLVR